MLAKLTPGFSTTGTSTFSPGPEIVFDMDYISVVQPIRHSPHVANGNFNVANGFVSEYIKTSIL
jgi:hypothetical protein